MQSHTFVATRYDIEANMPSTVENVQQLPALSSEEIEQAILREWNALQQVPSYVDRLIEANRDFIEHIAAQH